ncbi:MAG: LptF/LptG family permease, partial [Kangiellaceae bacterium]
RNLAKMLLPRAGWFAIISAFLSLFLTPWAISQSKTLLAEQAAQAKLGVFSAGRFKETSNAGIVFVDHKLEDGSIKGIFSVSREQLNDSLKTPNTYLSEEGVGSQSPKGNLEDGDVNNQDQSFQASSTNVVRMEQNELLKVQTAESGQQWTDEETNLDYLLLQNGEFFELNSSQQNWQKTEFQSSYTRIAQETELTVSNSIKAKSTHYLLQNLYADSDMAQKSWAALHWRIAAPISIPLICLLAIPLSRTQPRKGKFSRLFPSIMIYLIYVLLMMYSRKLIESGKLNEVLGFWWIHGLLAVGVYYLYRPSKQVNPPTKVVASNV